MASSTPLSKANTSFSLELLKQLSEDNQSGNIFCSPFSISSALAMVMLGARGNTATQMSECLKTQNCQDDVHSSFAQLLSEFNKPGAPFALSVANRLYGEQSYQFVEDFFKQIRKHYKAELEPVDFITRSEEVRININHWVEKQTQGKIKDMVGETVLSELTRLVLVNAIYFKGTWNEPFLRIETHDAEFRLNKRETKPVKMMVQKTDFPFVFIQDVNCKILEMPYKGKKLSMLIFLPTEIEDDTTGLEKLEKALTYEKFVAWTHPDKMKEHEVEVRLPRFTMEETYDLNTVLQRMGMVDAFDDAKCDFSGMSECKDLVLSKVTHKAFVEVNEEGTEAAAATTCYAQCMCGNLNLKYFTADHPFLFFIRHNSTMSILFAGRFCCPV
ncbi:leukocyte elastase inhibitor A-like [Archocentrus centrarchus]|uniref:leukocyte elastase inhibitor A-like n=1 Tax=Archocentrus centrarchus TaxID=63155 RepID=UPI0011EA05F4|nr:leukocyte elastase inhibitor A-like [Archocentrus centrarchus]